jgi:hypothetical protein
MKNLNPEVGFIALISILILSAVLLVTTFGLAQFGITNRFIILNLEQKASSEKLAEGCAYIARIKAYDDPTYTITTPFSIDIAKGSCTIYSVEISGNNSTIKVRADVAGAMTNFVVIVDRTTGDILSWEEVSSF